MSRSPKKTPAQLREGRRIMHQSAPGSKERLDLLNATIARAGGIIKFAAAVGVNPQAVTQWRIQRFVSLEKALRIEQLFGVPRLDLVSHKVAAALAAPATDAAADLL